MTKIQKEHWVEGIVTNCFMLSSHLANYFFILVRKMKYKCSICVSPFLLSQISFYLSYFYALSGQFIILKIYRPGNFLSSHCSGKFLEDLFENKFNSEGSSPAIREP